MPTLYGDGFTITHLFLYGSSETPRLLTDRLRDIALDDEGFSGSIDTNNYLATYAIYAVLARAPIVQMFFSGLLTEPGSYSMTYLLSTTNSELFGFDYINAGVDIGSNNYIDRSYTYGHASFFLAESTTFVIAEDGTRSLVNAAVRPVSDNFDWNSDGLSQYLNDTYLQPTIDPSFIGRTVNWSYSGSPATYSYSQQQYIDDVARIADWDSGYLAAGAAISTGIHSYVEAMRDAGVFETERDGRDIVYDGKGVNIVSVEEDKTSILIGGSGNELLRGSSGGDIFYGGADNDTMTGGGGSDEFWGGDEAEKPEYDDLDTVSYSENLVPVTIKYRETEDGVVIEVVTGTGVDHLHSIEKITGTTGRDRLKIVGSIAADTDLKIDANGGQSPNPRDTVDAHGASGAVVVWIPDDNGTGYVRSIDTGGKIDLVGFHTGIVGSDFDDTINDQSTGHKQIDGGLGNDTISAGGDGAMLFGGDGDDTVTGGDGNDLLDSGGGTHNVLVGGEGSDLLISRWGSYPGPSDELDGGEGADYLQTLGYGAILKGGAGNDVIDVRAGANTTIKFGADEGHDYVLTSVGSGFFFKVDFGALAKADVSFIFSDDVQNGLWFQPLGYPIDIAGTAWLKGDLTIIVNSTGASLTIQNVSGNANFDGFTYNGLTDLVGQIYPSIPELVLSDGTLTAVDFFYPGSAPSVIISGTNTYKTAPAEYAAAVLPPSEDSDSTSGNDSLTGGLGDDTLSGGAGDDEFATSGGNDELDGETGFDTLVTLGSSGQFRASFADSLMSLTDSSGPEGKLKLTSIEEIYFTGDGVTSFVQLGTTQADLMEAEGSAILYGNGGDDVLIGDDQSSQLFGGEGDDQIHGGVASDIIDGGQGADTLQGGAGSDQYNWSLGDGNDTIEEVEATEEYNELVLYDVQSGDVDLSQDGDDLLITSVISGEVVRIEGQFTGAQTGGVYALSFADAYWDRAAIPRMFPLRLS